MENIANIYYDELLDAENPAYVLTNFYCELFSKVPDKTIMLSFRELVKLFGRESVHFGVVEIGISYSHIKDGTRLFKLLRRIIAERHRRDIEGKHSDPAINLSDIIKERELANKKAKEAYDTQG